MKKVIGGFLCLILLMCALAGWAEEASFSEALAAWADMPRAAEDVSVPVLDCYEATDLALKREVVAGEEALSWYTANGSVTFTFDVPAAGLYNLALRYAQLDDTSMQIERGLLINGEKPYAELDTVYLAKRFCDSQYPFDTNEYGNEIRPRQIGVQEAVEALLYDRGAFYAEPLTVYFPAGENTLTLTGVKGSVAILGLTLKAPRDIPSDTVRADGKSGKTVIQEAEQLKARSSKSIQTITVSEPGVTPAKSGYKLLNALGGGNWKMAGDFVEWDFEVEEAGWYAFDFHYKQSYNTAMTSYRRLEIDGAVPSAAFAAVGFPFSASWNELIPGGKDAPDLVWLETGRHTLRLTCLNAPYRELYERMEKVVEELKNLDLSIKEIIGQDSDVYRIWKLETYIPTIADDLRRMTAEMEDIDAGLAELLGSSRDIGSLSATIKDLEKLSKRHNDIAKSTDSLSNIYTVFSDYLDAMQSQPLALDKFFVVPAGEALPEAGASFGEQLSYTMSSFVKSFVNSGTNAGARDENAVTVWVQRNRDYVDMMQLLADEYYTKETGVKVNVSYCPPGTQLLVLTNAAGEQPDIVTGVDIALPFEFGIRNALVDLSKMDGFDELIAPIAQGSRIPNYFSGAEYGIAEEVRVKVMFYRTDVLEHMGIKLPETWDEATQALATLLQNSYSFYYPYGDYLTFFYQNNVDVYTPDGLALGFNNEGGYKAFRQWTDLYLKYGLQPQMGSFYQHFRIGDVPLGIADLDQYMQFDMAASDISGRWKIALVPGTLQADGTLSRWQAGSQTGAVMFKTTKEREDRAWDFLRWWLSTQTQYLFADSMENYYGEEFRWFSANTEVVAQQAWPEDAKEVILEQLSWYRQLPMVPGGSYMTSRELWNAWNRIVLDKGNYREELETAIEDITLEINIKQQEMGYIDMDGNVLIPMDMMTIAAPAGKEE